MTSSNTPFWELRSTFPAKIGSPVLSHQKAPNFSCQNHSHFWLAERTWYPQESFFTFIIKNFQVTFMDRHVWVDNRYKELVCATYGPGAVRTNNTDFPKAVVGKTAKLKCFETITFYAHVAVIKGQTILSCRTCNKTKYNGDVVVAQRVTST